MINCFHSIEGTVPICEDITVDRDIMKQNQFQTGTALQLMEYPCDSLKYDN